MSLELQSFLDSPVFRDRLAFLRQSEAWPRPRLEALQISELQRVLLLARAKVPFYQRLFGDHAWRPEQFTSLKHLRRLPLVDKEAIMARPGDFLAQDHDPRQLMTRTTGGSTGEPLVVYFDFATKCRDLANTFYYVGVPGFDPRQHRSIRLYGDRVEVDEAAGVYWTWESPAKAIFSAYHVSEHTCRRYVEQINALAPHYLHGRPSAVAPLCQEISRQGLKVSPGVSYIFLEGEILPPVQRQVIEQALGGRVLITYGHTEGALLGFSCPHSRHIHMAPQVGVVELLAADGSAITAPGQPGEIVVTGFNNDVLPLLRYRTGDLGRWAAESCPCGRQYPLLAEVQGRIQDFVVSARGQAVPLTPALFNYNEVDWSQTLRFQVRQDQPGRLLLSIVPRPQAGLGQDLAAALARQLAGVLPEGFTVHGQAVPEIERTPRGKYKYLVQKLDLRPYLEGPEPREEEAP